MGVSTLVDPEDLYAQYPSLRRETLPIRSPATDEYNCVAWVERDRARWWEPGNYWPLGARVPGSSEDLDCYIDLFQRLGFEACNATDLEPGFLKIAIYAAAREFHHVAKQLPSGAWSSKGGPLHDFKHETLGELEDAGVMRGATVAHALRRTYDGVDDYAIEESGLLDPSRH